MRREKVGTESSAAAIFAAFFVLFLHYSAFGTVRAYGSQVQLSECQADAVNINQLNINNLRERDLDSLHLLTKFQIKSLLDYRREYGDILSVTELFGIDGFTDEDAEALESLLLFEPASGNAHPSHLITARFKKNWKSKGFSVTSKYKMTSRKVEVGFNLDNDPQEKFPDFISGYLKVGGFIIGDYDLKFGQGLVFSNGLSFSSFGEPAAELRREVFKGHLSSEECDFERGLAWSGTLGKFQLTAFGSFNGVDARLVARDGGSAAAAGPPAALVYTSIATDGLHATEAQRAKKNAMHEPLGGFNISRTFGTWRVGFTAVGYSYTKHNGRKVQEYNRLRMYDGFWGNFGVNLYGVAGTWRFFAEAAFDLRFSPAIKAGALWSPSYHFEASASLRAFSPAYTVTHASCDPYNQLGANLAVKYIVGGWKFNLNADYCFHPWYRYQLPAATSSFKARLTALRTWKSCALQMTWVTYGKSWRARIEGKFHIGRFGGALRAEGNPKGFAAYAEAGYRNRKFEATARVTYYNTKGWEGRIYLYERGVPQSFSTQAYYNKGIGEYLVLKYSPTKRIDLWLKAQQGYCAFFTRIFIPG